MSVSVRVRAEGEGEGEGEGERLAVEIVRSSPPPPTFGPLDVDSHRRQALRALRAAHLATRSLSG